MPQSKCGALPLGYEAISKSNSNIQKVVEGDGFEPSNPKEQIYSLPRLASSLPFQQIMVPEIGLEPTTY
jgi:hypothetical protein